MDSIINIVHSIEKEDGTYVFQGTFTGRELDFLVEHACNTLMAAGALPFLTKETHDKSPSPFNTSTVEQ